MTKRCQYHVFQPHKLQLIPSKILQIHLEQAAENKDFKGNRNTRKQTAA